LASASNGGWAAAIIAAPGVALIAAGEALIAAGEAHEADVRVVVLTGAMGAALVLVCGVAAGGAPTKTGTETLVSWPLVE